MIRTFLGVGDKATNGAFITQGLDSVSCSNPPPCVQISTVGMKTYCPVCKQEGHIAPRGPRWPGTGPNGRQWALSGDINLCDCNPPPTFHAERNMTMSFTSEQAAALMGKGIANRATVAASASGYAEQVRPVAARASLSGYPYYIETTLGDVYSGRIDSFGLLPRIPTDGADQYTVYWGDEALARQAEA